MRWKNKRKSVRNQENGILGVLRNNRYLGYFLFMVMGDLK